MPVHEIFVQALCPVATYQTKQVKYIGNSSIGPHNKINWFSDLPLPRIGALMQLINTAFRFYNKYVIHHYIECTIIKKLTTYGCLIRIHAIVHVSLYYGVFIVLLQCSNVSLTKVYCLLARVKNPYRGCVQEALWTQPQNWHVTAYKASLTLTHSFTSCGLLFVGMLQKSMYHAELKPKQY